MNEFIKFKQRGMIFVISVIMMLVLAGLSITLLSTGANERGRAGGDQDLNLAKQSADHAVAVAKQAILDNWWIGQTPCIAFPCTCSGVCVWAANATNNLGTIDFTQQNDTFWSNYGTQVTTQSNVSDLPRYIIIDSGCDHVASLSRYRIVSRAKGAKVDTVAFSDQGFSVPPSVHNRGNISTEVLYFGTASTVVAGVPTPISSISLPLSPSQVSTFFFTNDSGSLCPGTNHTIAAQCEVNCAGYFRVSVYAYENSCGPIHGPWESVGSPTSSSVNITSNGTQYLLECGQ